ncbi:Ig-like domain-containing protein [Gordonibacter pamelaeae]|uniref:Ig-like domain-containing protein n=1 Tax=Gordonibacter pamelaeae TaxID=471189 RepID=UPI00142EC112
MADGTVVYRIAVYDQEDGTVYPKATPAYYRYVDRDLNELSRSAYTEWITWQQTKRTLGDGTVMTYTANDAGKYGAVDAEGEALIPFEYDAYYDCGDHESLILLKKGDAWEFFDTSTIDTKKEPVPAMSVTISGAPEQLAVGATAQLTAAVEPANSTDKVMWATSDDKVLTVDASGKVTAIANGKATVTATAGDRSALVEIAVTTPATSVTISGAPEKPLNVGGTAQLTATVQSESSTDKVEWASSSENVLTVDADGLVTALANGEATITATAGEQTASVAITVVTPAAGIELDAEALTLYVGDEPSQLEATVLPATASDKGVAWTSSNSDVAMVDDNGAVTPVGVGTCTVTATTLDGGLTAECAVTVGEHVAGVALDKSEVSIVGVGTTQLVATVSPAGALDKSVAWSASDKSVATVNENGLVTAVGKGTAVITATSLEDEQQSASCTVTVSNPVTGFDLSAASVALVKGDAQTVNVAAFGALSGAVDDYDLTFSVEGKGSLSNGVWSDASGNAVFSVAASEGGNYAIAALGTGKGTLVFEAQQESSTVKGVVAVSVTNPAKAIALDVTSKQLTVGDEPFTLTATVDPLDADEAGSIAWSTSNSAVATVDGGKVTPLGVGSATITAKVGDVSATCEVAAAAKEIAATEGDSAYQASVEVSSPAAAEQLDKIAQGNGGSLSLAVQGAQDLTESAQQTITSLQGGQTKVAEILDVSLRNADGGEVAVSLEDGTMTVRLRMTDAMRALDPKTLEVSHVADNGAIEKKPTWVDGDDLCFATEHFSTYVVTGSERQTSGGEIGGGSAGGSGTVLPGGGGSGQDEVVKPLLAPTGDTLALPMALAGCAIAAALVCLAFVRGGRRVK